MINTEKIMEGCFLASAEDESVLFGCPSEALKAMKLRGKEMPVNIVLPEKFYYGGIVQANLEFPVYNFLFVQGRFFKGEKLRIIGEKDQLRRIRELLELCVLGPTEDEMIAWGASSEMAGEQVRVASELGLKNPNGSLAQINDMIEFVEFKNDEAYAGKLKIKNNGDNLFTIISGEESLPVDLNFYGHQEPPIPVEHIKRYIGRPAFGITALSKCTTGFDPTGYTTGWILFVNSQAYMVDGVPWTKEHLRSLGINNSEVKGYILSHIHEDHTSIMEAIINGKKANIITTEEIFHAFCKKTSLILGWEFNKVKEMVDFTEAVAGIPFNLYGAEFNFFRVVHPISTIGFEVEMEGKKIVYSGDTVWGSRLKELLDKGIISQRTYEAVDKIPKIEADLTIMDGGGGLIHPRHVELNELPWERKNHMFLTHCSAIEKGSEGLRVIYPGQQLDLIPAKSYDIGDINAIINTPILKEVGNNWINAVLSRGQIIGAREGDIILKEGFPGKDFYIILSGVFSVIVNREEMAKLQTGDFFGEKSLMDAVGCSATIAAETDARILAIPKKIFLDMIKVTGLAERMRKLHRIRPIMIQCGWIRDLSPDIVNKIIAVTEERFYKAGEKIIVQDELGREIFFIRDGRVSVVVSGNNTGKIIATLYRGQFFGEMALLQEQTYNQKHNSTVVAETDVSVLVIKKEDFKRLLNELPMLLYTFGVMAHERSEKH